MTNQQKTAIVTGANRGLGLEISRQLLAQGYYVILTARNPQQGQHAVQTLQKNYNNVEFQPLDVTQTQSIDTLTQRVTKQLGRCDVLVNNAGIFPDPRDANFQTPPSIFDASIDTIRAGMETNVYGPIQLCQALIPLMQKHNYGRIVNMSSGMGQLADMNGCCPGYRISKTSLNVITRVFADELQGNNILINSMCPGWVKTDMGGPHATRAIPEGADTAVWLATLPDGGPSGGYFRDRAPIPW